MEMRELSAPLVTSASRATIPHQGTNPNDDFYFGKGLIGRTYSLEDKDWKLLQTTIENCKPHTSWSTALRFNFSWKNPFVSSYLIRGANLAAITFSYFSGVLPSFSPKIAMGASALFEVVPLSLKHLRDRYVFPVTCVLIFPLMFQTGEWMEPDKKNEDKDAYDLVMLTAFQAFFIVNCIFTYKLGKPEHDLKLQLENLQELLEKYPALETNLELRHSDSEALDNAFVDNEGKPILSPFYQVVRGETCQERRYLKLDELYTLIKTKNDAGLIYCDRARFQKVLTIFKNAQTSNA